MRIAPSILAADMADLAAALDVCERGGADEVHFDVMDGHFVPNLTIGLPVLQSLARRTELPLDVHLMVSNPDRLLDDWIDAGADCLLVHQEASVHLDRLLGRIRARGARAGVVLNPATPVETLTDILPSVDRVLLMSVNPGFGGQSFLPYVLDKARRLSEMIHRRTLDVDVALDGGVGPGNIRSIAQAGVDLCVAGSSVFGADDPVRAISELKIKARLETA